ALTMNTMLEIVALVLREQRDRVRLGRKANLLGRRLIHVEQVRRLAHDARIVHRAALLACRVTRGQQHHRRTRARDTPEKLPARGHTTPASSALFSAGFITAAYPVCTGRRCACGHITIRPPIAITNPPIHTQTTSGLNETRNSAISSPFTLRIPASTRYVSRRAVLWIPASVDGLNNGWRLASRYERFSLDRMPRRFPSRNISTPTAITLRSIRFEVDAPWLTKRH